MTTATHPAYRPEFLMHLKYSKKNIEGVLLVNGSLGMSWLRSFF